MIWEYSNTFAQEIAEEQRINASLYEEAWEDLCKVIISGPQDKMQIEIAKYTQHRAAERSASVRTMMGIAHTWNDIDVEACDDPLPLDVATLDGATITDIFCDRRGHIVIRFDTDEGEIQVSTFEFFDQEGKRLPLGDIRYADE